MNIALTEKSTAYPLFQRASAVGCKREQKLLRERAFVSEGRPRLGLRQSLSEKSEWNREFFTRLLIAFMHQEAVFTFPAAQLGISREKSQPFWRNYASFGGYPRIQA